MIAEALRQFFVDEEIAPCPVLVAVSGGVDSTALLFALADFRASGFTIAAAHVNHRLRGAESDEDEAFVRSLCDELEIVLHVADGTLDPERIRERGIEAAAREVRYRALEVMRARSSSRFLATAHQKDDQAETVLMRLLSGSGLAGLRGIHPRREDGVIRPLLGVTRAQLESFLSERGVTHRLDRSNEDPRFLRNRVRRIVRELEATEQLAKVAAQARAQWPVFEAAIEDAERMHVTSDARETRFHSWPNDEWLRAALLQRHIHRLDPEARDFDAVRIARSLDEIKRVTVTRKLELLRKGGALILRMRMDPCEPYEYEAHGEEWTIGIESIEKVLRLERFDEASTRASQKIQLANGSTGNWRVRNRRPGDRLQPLGMPNAKKLKDFLIDRKIPAETRDRIPLLLWNDEIVWVAGIEVAERFKVTASEGVIYEVWMEDPR